MGHAELAELAGELGAGLGVHDPAGIDQRLRRAEQLDALEEERALLREEEGEALVHRDLALVALHLAEVGIEGRVERVAGEAEPEIEPRVGIDVLAVELPAPPGRGSPLAVAVTNGWASTVTPCRRSCSPPMRALLADEARVGPAHVGPGVGVAGALDDAGDVEAPGLPLAAGIAQALERDPDLDLVAPVGDPALRFPDEVGILVDAARAPGCSPGRRPRSGRRRSARRADSRRRRRRAGGRERCRCRGRPGPRCRCCPGRRRWRGWRRAPGRGR